MSKQRENTITGTLIRFGLVVRSQRKLLGISQEELAHRSGLHRTYITDIERGARNMTIDSITKLSKALQIGLTDLLSKVEMIPNDGGMNPGEPSKIVAPAQVKPANILLVEDDPEHVEETLHALQHHGVANAVFVANTGEDALDLLHGEPPKPVPKPDVVLLDLSLPKMDGLEVLQRIRSHHQTRLVSVVILTAPGQGGDFKEARKFGVSAYITKPVDFAEFSTVMPKIGFRWALLEKG